MTEDVDEQVAEENKLIRKVKPMVQIGKKALDFAAPAYQKGKFISVKLSEYLGKWVLPCFYTGDVAIV